MATITTIPSPVISNQPATLYYSNIFPIPIPGSTYVLQLGGSSVSNTYTGVPPTETTISTNVVSTGATVSSSCVYYNGNIYTSMMNSNIPGNGYIQKTTSNGFSSIYLQFNLSSSPPIPGPNPYGATQYPTGLSIDSNGNLYFLVFGNNNVYRITDLNTPSNYVIYNTTASTISAPYHMTINLNTNFLYLSATNPPYYIEQINTSGVTSQLTGYSFTQASYGICCDLIGNLYIGYASGVIGKYNLGDNTFTSNFYTIPSETGTVYGLTYIAVSDSLIANVGPNGNIYTVPVTQTINSTLIKNSSGILGNFGFSGANIIYGTSSTQIISYTFNQTFTFNNLLLSQPTNSLSLYNQTTSQIIDTFTVNTNTNTNPQTFYKVGGLDLSNIFQPLTGTPSSIVTKYNVPGYGDLNTIFAPYPGTGAKASPTGYTVGGNDLNNIFAKYFQNYEVSGNYTVTSNPSYNTIITFTGSGNITFNIATTINYVVVGGGGGGGNARLNNTTTATCGGGGGGGEVVTGSVTTVVSQTETIVIGNGGTYDTNNAQNTTISGTYLNITATAGTGSTGNSGESAGGGVGVGGNGAVVDQFFIQSQATSGSNGTNTSFGYFGGSGGGGGGEDENGGQAIAGFGGSGGGGMGGYDTSQGNNGAVNTGGGGGGGGNSPNGPQIVFGGNGGSGIAIIYFNI